KPLKTGCQAADSWVFWLVGAIVRSSDAWLLFEQQSGMKATLLSKSPTPVKTIVEVSRCAKEAV
ncbi:MAG TPA: hypothetical protein VGI75_16100, partial [Pirellulales bacterium]